MKGDDYSEESPGRKVAAGDTCPAWQNGRTSICILWLDLRPFVAWKKHIIYFFVSGALYVPLKNPWHSVV